MTDEQRRSSDQKIDEVLDRFHKRGLYIEQLAEGQKANSENIKRMLSAIEGEPIINTFGVTVGYEGGMRNDITDMKADIKTLKTNGNGGKGLSMRTKDKWQIIIGVLAVVIPVVVVLITQFSPNG